jgi:hypothetical protein
MFLGLKTKVCSLSTGEIPQVNTNLNSIALTQSAPKMSIIINYSLNFTTITIISQSLPLLRLIKRRRESFFVTSHLLT